jgi:hypothetical protein
MSSQDLLEDLLKQPLHGVRLCKAKYCNSKQVSSNEKLIDLSVWLNKTRRKTTAKAIWEKTDRGLRYQSLLRLFKTPKGHLLQIDCEGKGEFEYTSEGIGIFWEQSGTEPAHYFQALGLGLWLETRGIPCIHANGLAVDDFNAIGIIAPSRMGKSTLTLALLESGLELMTDDMLALHPDKAGWKVSPGWSQIRLWPDMASALIGDSFNSLDRVHSRFEKRKVELSHVDKFRICNGSRALKKLYLLERKSEEKGEIEFQDVTPGNALIHMLQNSILADAYRGLGIEQMRLDNLADVLGQVELKKIVYPTGLNHLPKLCEQILIDVKIVSQA